MMIESLARWVSRIPGPIRVLILPLYRHIRELAGYPFWILRRLQYRIAKRDDATPRIGVHTVFIAKENILFLKEWILYHKWKGIDSFFLYDNSGGAGAGEKYVKRMRRNKYAIPYHDIVTLSDAEITDILDHIQREIPNVHIVKWRPTDSEGRIMHAQTEAHNDALRRFGPTVDWMVFMDLDEFLVSSESIPEIARRLERGGYDGGLMYDRVMTSRFDHLDKYVTDTTLAFDASYIAASKYICKVNRTWLVAIHGFISLSRRLKFSERELFYLHYKFPSSHPDLRDQFKESENPISPEWRDTLKTQSGLYCDVEWKLSAVNPEWKRIMKRNAWRHSPDP